MRTAVIYNFLLESTIMASLAIVLLIPVCKFLRGKLGNRTICFAWLLVAIRLLCPLTLPNPIIHSIQSPYNYDQAHIRPIAGQVRVRLGDAIDRWHWNVLRSGCSSGKEYSEICVDPAYQLTDGLSYAMYNGRLAHWGMYVYAAGAVGTLGWFALSNARFRRRLRKSRIEPISGDMLEMYQALCWEMKAKPLPVYLADPLPGACLVGVIRPWIALPLTAGKEEAMQMLRHEMWHQKARDPWWMALQLACCAVHWFNPLVWLGAYWSRMDREMKCDENVTRGMDDAGKRAYAAVLVQSAARRAQPGLPVLATGMSMPGKKLKARVSAILSGGKRLLALSVAFAVTASLLLVCAFATTDPEAPGPDPTFYDYYANAVRLDAAKYGVPAQPALSITDADAALERVKTALKSDYMRMDVSEGNWTAQMLETYPMDVLEEGYGVTCVAHETEYIAYVRQNGVLSYIDAQYPSEWDWIDETRLPMSRVPDFDRLAAYALEAAEYMAPGIQERMEGMYFLWEEHPGGPDDVRLLRFVFRVPGEIDWEMALEYTPEIRVWSFAQGNG